MRIVIPRESVAGEHRTSATPETVKKMIRLGADVAIESGAGAAVGFTDSVYTCLLYTSPSPRDKRQSRMPSSA